jgi:site-specific recombinase XerD
LQALHERKQAQLDAEYVFRDAGRDPQHNYRRWFNDAITEAKIADCSWHCNRHAFASRLVMAGVDLRAVAELMGHSSIQMSMRYAHLAPLHNRTAVDRLVPAVKRSRRPKKGAKAAITENILVTKSVTG